ncbi:hypothetical protein RHMOL_Rhmol06G0169300 [Rhododendron molle]|uniref:Uncharacterized protein n=1 Tax=Rhododendron molle TaxID=49168 RepID=A0ACC0NES7_RHOML|nr:hypothetical protein RHMOL_Rhmol06G0169300 [Rhododendron molle]
MGVTFAAGEGDNKIAPAGEESGLTDVDAEGFKQASGVVQVAEALHLVRHDLFKRAAARCGRRAGDVYILKAGYQFLGAQRRQGIRHSGAQCHHHHRDHRCRENYHRRKLGKTHRWFPCLVFLSPYTCVRACIYVFPSDCSGFSQYVFPSLLTVLFSLSPHWELLVGINILFLLVKRKILGLYSAFSATAAESFVEGNIWCW